MTMFGNITEGLFDTIMTVRKNGQSNHYPSNINASLLNKLYRFMSHAKKTKKNKKQKHNRLYQNMQWEPDLRIF